MLVNSNISLVFREVYSEIYADPILNSIHHVCDAMRIVDMYVVQAEVKMVTCRLFMRHCHCCSFLYPFTCLLPLNFYQINLERHLSFDCACLLYFRQC